MPIGIRYFGSTKPGPGAKPIKVVDKIKVPFGKKNYPVNWMTGKHLALGADDSATTVESDFELPTIPFFYDSDTHTLTPGVCYINGIKTTITLLPTSISVPSVSTCYYVQITHITKEPVWRSGTTFPDLDGYGVIPILRIVVSGGVVTDIEQRQWSDIVYVIPPLAGSAEGQLCEWNHTDKRWEPSAAPTANGQVAYWNASTKTWTMSGAPVSNGQLMSWNGSAWIIPPAPSYNGQLLVWTGSSWWTTSMTGVGAGDLLQWSGTAWLPVRPVTVTVVTDYQYDLSSHYLQKKTRNLVVLSAAAESGWTNVTGGDAVPES